MIAIKQIKNVLRRPPVIAAIFFTLLIAMLLNIGLHKSLHLRPQSIHQWAQCDRASVALNFALNRTDFFKPMVHECSNGTGISGMEFPIVNFTTSLLYKLFGYNEAYYRILVCSIALLGLMAAFFLARFFLRDGWAIAVVILFVQSPVLLYYMPNFLPDAVSLGFSLIAWLLFFKTKHKSGNLFLVLLFITTALASLIKVTALVNTVAMLMYVLVQYYLKAITKVDLRKRTACLILSIVITLVWYNYARWLSAHYNSYYFLMAPHHPHSFNEALQALARIKDNMQHEYYTVVMGYVLLAGSIVAMANYKKVNRSLLFVTLTLYVGFGMFFLLMLNQFVYHDYYFITLMPAVLFHLLLIADSVQRQKHIVQYICVLPLLVAANYGMNICKKNFTSRYNEQSWYYSNVKSKSYFNFETVLRNCGITADEKVLSFTDETPNTSLYLMNQRGISMSTNTDLWQPYLDSNFHYAVINDSNLLHRKLKPYLNKQLAFENGLYVYSLKTKPN
jgi:hypothetical protein